MRLFKIEEQPKNYLFDLDGNVYHQKLRDEIEPGMVVGLRISDRELPKISDEKRIKDINEYNRLRNEYERFLIEKDEQLNLVRIEIQKLIENLAMKSSELLDKQQQNNEKMKERFHKSMSNKDNPTTHEYFKTLNKELIAENLAAEIEILDINDQIKDLSYKARSSIIRTDELVEKYGFSKELSDKYEGGYERFEDLEVLMFGARITDKPWTEIIFFKVVKKTGDKLYGDVLDLYRRLDSKCPLKTNDRISFNSKSILFVPSSENRKTKLNSYRKTDFTFQFLESKKITDWTGEFLDKEALNHLTPGSIVRIQFKEKSEKYGQTWYVYILKKEGKVLTGELLDIYKDMDEYFDDPYKIGCIHTFKDKSIIEIPLMWNETQPILEKFIDRDRMGYAVTGFRWKDDYYEL